jgi:D-alanyl-D-alanine carboxypeptidase
VAEIGEIGLLYLFRMKRIILYSLTLIFFVINVGYIQAQANTSSWQTHMDSLVAYHDMKGMLIHVEAPKQHVSWTGAGGVAEISTLRPLTGNEPFRIASITKTFVATTILRLWEDGKIQLDDPVTRYISSKHTDILRTDGYAPEKITLRHLLTHTSGLYDHGSSSEYVQAIFDRPEYQWTRTEQIQRMVDWGRPVGKPGERFSYSDTGYLTPWGND